MSDESFFHKARALAPAERDAFLKAHCPDLSARRRLEDLLAAHDAKGGLLDEPAATREFERAEDDRTDAAGSVEHAGLVIGPYKLLQKLGEGGMGAVWAAEQAAPVRRRVALKLIKAGMDSAQVLWRFEAERQALALMEHPNIAKVLDAGATPQGRPYFAMELIKGIPITKYCDQERLTPKERLELFIPVCQAVQHAHQKGIIHRDLKPSNVLIALYDGKAVPKVIDFGVAKATNQRMTERTVYTEVGQIVGTLEYMAPEQAELNNLDIDTRADVYSLGVILYELLTGSPPFTAKQLRGAAFSEMLRMIREVEPPRPSTRISSSEELPSIAANRKLEPNRLTRLVHGDLDWIVMKALEKERGRRYETANGFAMDLQRHLADEPIEARPPSAAYRFQKFVRRNRPQVMAATLVLLALLAGITGTTIGFFRAETRRAEAEQARKDETKARETAEAVAAFMKEVFAQAGARGQASISREVKRELTVKEAMDFAARAIAGRFPGRPEVEAAVRTTVGETYIELADFAHAREQLQLALAIQEEARGPNHPDTFLCANNLGRLFYLTRDLAAAEALYRRALSGQEATRGPDHPETLSTVNNLAALYYAKGDLPAAEPFYRRAFAGREKALGADHRDTLESANNLAIYLRTKGDLAAAEPLHRRVWDGYEKALGPDHPDTLTSINNLAELLRMKKDYSAAEPLFRRAIAGQERVLGPEHPDTLGTINNLAVLLFMKGDLPGAEPLLRRALAGKEKTYGLHHPDVLMGVNNLAVVNFTLRRHAAAVPLFERALAGYQSRSESTYTVLVTRVYLGLSLLGAGRPADAEPHLLAGYDGLANLKGLDPQQYLQWPRMAAKGLVELYQTAKNPAKADEWRAKLAALTPEKSATSKSPKSK